MGFAAVPWRQPAARSPLEILDLRHFSSVDLRPLLEDETQVWSRLLSWDYSGSAEMILRYVDAKILPGYAAVDRGRVFGYSFFVYEGSKGVIGDLYVINGNRLPECPRGRTEAADACDRNPAAISGDSSRGGAVAGARSQLGFAPVSRHRISAASAAVHDAAAGQSGAGENSHPSRGGDPLAGPRPTINLRPPSLPRRIAATSMPRSTTSTTPSADRCASSITLCVSRDAVCSTRSRLSSRWIVRRRT